MITWGWPSWRLALLIFRLWPLQPSESSQHYYHNLDYHVCHVLASWDCLPGTIFGMSSWLYMRFILVRLILLINQTNVCFSFFLISSAPFCAILDNFPTITSVNTLVGRQETHSASTKTLQKNAGYRNWSRRDFKACACWRLVVLQGFWRVKLDRWQMWEIHQKPRVPKVDESHLPKLSYDSLNSTVVGNYTDITTETNDHQPVLSVG